MAFVAVSIRPGVELLSLPLSSLYISNPGKFILSNIIKVTTEVLILGGSWDWPTLFLSSGCDSDKYSRCLGYCEGISLDRF